MLHNRVEFVMLKYACSNGQHTLSPETTLSAAYQVLTPSLVALEQDRTPHMLVWKITLPLVKLRN